jgi:hypothetical protein
MTATDTSSSDKPNITAPSRLLLRIRNDLVSNHLVTGNQSEPMPRFILIDETGREIGPLLTLAMWTEGDRIVRAQHLDDLIVLRVVKGKRRRRPPRVSGRDTG